MASRNRSRSRSRSRTRPRARTESPVRRRSRNTYNTRQTRMRRRSINNIPNRGRGRSRSRSRSPVRRRSSSPAYVPTPEDYDPGELSPDPFEAAGLYNYVPHLSVSSNNNIFGDMQQPRVPVVVGQPFYNSNNDFPSYLGSPNVDEDTFSFPVYVETPPLDIKINQKDTKCESNNNNNTKKCCNICSMHVVQQKCSKCVGLLCYTCISGMKKTSNKCPFCNAALDYKPIKKKTEIKSKKYKPHHDRSISPRERAKMAREYTRKKRAAAKKSN